MEENNINENFETAFSSPIPLFVKVKNLIFGENNPELIFKITIYINLIIWSIFLLWHTLSYFAISFRDIILEEKKINVEILILNRGSELGYDPSVFMNRLLNFHSFSMFLWLLIFVGIALMWRQKLIFKYFIGIPLILYLIFMFFYLGLPYYKEDTTFFDKLMFIIFLINTVFYYIMLKNKNSGTDSNFFTSE